MSGNPLGFFLEGAQEKAANPEADSRGGPRVYLMLR